MKQEQMCLNSCLSRPLFFAENADLDEAIGRTKSPIFQRVLLVPAEGIEPPTFGLQNRCSTAELSRLEAAPV
jgi:hypothetical protein